MRRCNTTIYLGPMPGTQEPFENWLAALQEYAIDAVVCLTQADEIRAKSPEYAEWRAGDRPERTEKAEQPNPELLDVPIGDNQAPGDPAAFWEAAAYVAELSSQDQRVFIHCRGGRGRTGLFAVAVLLQQGHSLASALRTVQEAGSSPQAEVQREFLRQAVPSRLSD